MPVRQLVRATVNRIAAGEVVERPASVVKELVENALDAGAQRDRDRDRRRRAPADPRGDDGDGMTRADLALAVERHATSKLADDDLLDIRTLGFRGEALPSIGSVARLSSPPATRGEPHAWSIAVDAGAKSEVKPAALGEGTRVEVRDLFYATPARLKFLKTDRTEGEAIREIVRRLAMSRPDVAFTLAGEERMPGPGPRRCPARPGVLRGSPIFSERNSAQTRSRCRVSATALRSKALPRCPRIPAPMRSGSICSSTEGRCATSS